MSRLDSLNEDTLKLPYSNSIDEINPDTSMLTNEITLNKNKITTDQLTNYSEFLIYILIMIILMSIAYLLNISKKLKIMIKMY